MANSIEMCQACERGDHRYCGMQTWCACDDPEDGEATREEFEAYHTRIVARRILGKDKS